MLPKIKRAISADEGLTRGYDVDADVVSTSATERMSPSELMRELMLANDRQAQLLQALDSAVQQEDVRAQSQATLSGLSEDCVSARSVTTVGFDHALLGESLEHGDISADEREHLLADIVEQQPTALELIGRWLVFRAARPESRPEQVRELGEAYYRWIGRLDQEPAALRDALITAIEQACAEAGTPIHIQLVRCGDRFDRNKHQAAAGVEITEVDGWVVCRSNGTTYTKAAVTTR